METAVISNRQPNINPVGAEYPNFEGQKTTDKLRGLEMPEFETSNVSLLGRVNFSGNYINDLNELIAVILAQVNTISQKDRDQLKALKAEYKELSAKSAKIQKDLGAHSLKFAAISLAASLLQIPGNEDDKAIAKVFAERFCPGLGDLFKGSMDADQQKASSFAQLVLNEINDKINKGQSNSQSKQEVIGILNEVNRVLKEAAQGR